MSAYLNQVACAVPPFERQEAFLESLPLWVGTREIAEKLRQVALGSTIERRYTVLPAPFETAGPNPFYRPGDFPGTGERMKMYQREAPLLAASAIAHLQRPERLAQVTHLIVTTCTGFYAPGLDVDIVRQCGLSPNVQRTIIGFMGCHAALVGLRNAKQIVEADPDALVLMVNLELCSLHLQQTARMDRLISFLLFSDGCAASLISGTSAGMRLDDFTSHLSLADAERMAWHIEDSGFAMTLDSRLPARIRQWFAGNEELRSVAGKREEMRWAIHPGGRLILDAVQQTCGISDAQMACSREVLRRFGNMSSASIMFILRDLLAEQAESEVERAVRAIAFGPGLTVETGDLRMMARSGAAVGRG
jgi:predicted naringenin-chalcone synthase